MSYFRSIALGLGLVISVSLSICPAKADIVWQTPVTISGDSDVSTTGVGVRAWSGSATTINGVTFSLVHGFSPINAQSGGSGFGGTSTFYNGLTDQYKLLLDFATFNASGTGFENEPGRMAINLTGLTTGNVYEFQAFVNDSRDSASFSFTGERWNIFDSGSGTEQSQSVFQPLRPGPSNIGQYIKGTFTANSASQLIRISGDATVGPRTSLINAYQLRDITAVPEPSSLLLLASITGIGFAFIRRARRSVS